MNLGARSQIISEFGFGIGSLKPTPGPSHSRLWLDEPFALPRRLSDFRLELPEIRISKSEIPEGRK